MFVVSINSIDTIKELNGLNVDTVLITDNCFGCCQKGFSLSQIKECIKLAHQNNIAVWARVNKLYNEFQLDDLKEYIDFLIDEHVDGILFTDMAVKVIVGKRTKLIYAPETLLTNSLDVQFVLQQVDSCVISKDIPLNDSIDIAKENDNCYIRIHGPILISYSARRFISSYLDKYDDEYTDNYFISEETRENEYLPIIEKKDGTWLFGHTLMSYQEISELVKCNFKGFIIDNSVLYDDEYTLQVLKKYNDILNNKQTLEIVDEKHSYISISDIRKTERLKEE